MNKQPTGTVTFLFTDIVGSTAIWEAFPKTMPAALARHDAILERVADNHRGYVFKKVGDGFCIAFQSSIDALNAAVAGQLALQAENWDATNPLQVRMAVHASIAIERDGDYYGSAVNRVARLLNLAHGGQILLSEAIMALARDPMPAQFDCLDLGFCSLKGLRQPEHVYQLMAPGLPVDFPPLSIEEQIATNLPKALTPFVGRQIELAQIDQYLQDNRLLTIAGPGGVGKTRLALEAAARQYHTMQDEDPKGAPRFADGVFFVPLAALESADDILPALNQALGFQPSSEFGQGRSSRQQLLDFLRGKRLLLILDNFEQLSAGTGLVLDLLAAAPEVKILVTSRERLSLQGEQLLPLQGMRYPTQSPAETTAEALHHHAAIQLFLQTAHSVVPGFRLRQEDVSQLTRICRLVDGLPLALELAAGWVDILSLENIAAEIERDLSFLESDLKGVPSRHRSMEAVFQGTWRHLEAEEKELFRQLSIFRGGFTLEAAQAITGASLAQLATLNRKSLLNYERGQNRYQMHRLLRQYGNQQLAADQVTENQIRERHCDYYCQLLERWGQELKGAGQIKAMAEFDLDVHNAQVAWEEAVERTPEDQMWVAQIGRMVDALGQYFVWRFWPNELEGACRQAAEKLALRSDPESKRILSKVLSWQGWFAPDDEDRQLLEQSLVVLNEAEAEGIEVTLERAFALRRLGSLTVREDREGSFEHLMRALALYEARDDSWGAASTFGNLAGHAILWGQYRETESYCRRRVKLCRELGDQRGLAESFLVLGINATYEGDFEEAEPLIQRSIDLSQELGDAYWLREGYDNLGFLLWNLGRFAQAQAAYEECLRIRADLGINVGEPTAMVVFMLAQKGEYESAYTLCEEAINGAGRDLAPFEYAFLSYAMGALCLSLRQRKEAVQWLEESVSIFENTGQLTVLAGASATLTMAEPGIKNARQTIVTAREAGSFLAYMMALPAVALHFLAQEEIERALELYVLASNYPIVSGSCWYEDLVGRPVRAAAANLPQEAVDGARNRGRQRDLESTFTELAAEFASPPPPRRH